MNTKKPIASDLPAGSDVSGQNETFKPEPDAWERFEKAVGKVVKAPPRHRGARPPTDRRAPTTKREDAE